MKKEKELKKKKNTGTIDVRRLIDESGVNISSSESDKIMISAEIFRKLTYDIYQLGYLTLEASEELEYLLERFFNNQVEVELDLC